jgi:hypothetical protein
MCSVSLGYYTKCEEAHAGEAAEKSGGKKRRKLCLCSAKQYENGCATVISSAS